MQQYEEHLLALLNDDANTLAQTSEAALLSKLAAAVEELIQHDFPKLVQILYRVDISEARLKENLAQNSPENTAQIIALMLLERQKQKLALRQSFRSSQAGNIPDEERW